MRPEPPLFRPTLVPRAEAALLAATPPRPSRSLAERWQALCQRLFVRERLSAVERAIRRATVQGRPIVLGSLEQPYAPQAGGEQALELAPLCRALLSQAGQRLSGVELALTTCSSVALEPLDLLVEVDERHAVTIDVPLPAVAAELMWAVDEAPQGPEERLLTVSKLAERGLATRIVTRLIAGVNDGREALCQLFAAARSAGAFDVVAIPAPRHLEVAEDAACLFRRLALEHGFPRPLPGRG